MACGKASSLQNLRSSHCSSPTRNSLRPYITSCSAVAFVPGSARSQAGSGLGSQSLGLPASDSFSALGSAQSWHALSHPTNGWRHCCLQNPERPPCSVLLLRGGGAGCDGLSFTLRGCSHREHPAQSHGASRNLVYLCFYCWVVRVLY